jgi:hypothetical protein
VSSNCGDEIVERISKDERQVEDQRQSKMSVSHLPTNFQTE